MPPERLRVVIVSTYSPEPPNSGGRIRLASLIAAISQSHELGLVLLTDATDDDVARIRRSGAAVEHERFGAWDTLPLRWRLLYNVVALMRGTAPSYEHVNRARTRAAITRAVSHADLVIIDTTSLSPYAAFVKASLPNLPVLINTHDVDSQLYLRLSASSSVLGKLHKRLLAASAMRLERSFHRHADGILAVSESDARALRSKNRDEIRVHVVPNTVDTEHLTPLPVASEPTVIFCGVLNYQPNVEAVRWFIREVWPRVRAHVPSAKLLLVGRRPAAEIEGYAREEGIELYGDVPDVRPFYARSAVSIVPLLRGGGTRLKILEAMAFGRVVVSTSIGAEGLTWTPGLIVTDEPEDFARRVVTCLVDGASPQLARSNADYVTRRYSWQSIVKPLREILATYAVATIGADVHLNRRRIGS